MTAPLAGFERGSCWVLDSSAAINFKRRLSEEQRGRFWPWLLDFVRRGELTFPQQVWEEVGDVKFPDDLALWAAEAKAVIGSLPAAGDEVIAELVGRYPNLVKGAPEGNPADPHVVALAVELRSEGLAVCVIADDRDIRQACTAYDIVPETADEFLQRFLRA